MDDKNPKKFKAAFMDSSKHKWEGVVTSRNY